MLHQRTIREKVVCRGIGLHTGQEVTLELFPAPVDSGIRFVRADLPGHDELKASIENLVDTRLATTLGVGGEGTRVTISTVEHLMAALAGLGIDNLVVHVDGPELPIMDGSSGEFVAQIQAAGIEEQNKGKRYLVIKKEVEVRDGDKFARLAPGSASLQMKCSLEFDHPLIPPSAYEFKLSERSFVQELCRARTFGFMKDVEMLQANGLARGGSLDNAIVIDDYQVLNPEGLRFPDEFVRHKVLDAIGDLALFGLPVIGRVRLHCSGHALNTRLVEAVLQDPRNYEIVELELEAEPHEAASKLLSVFEPVELLA
ncbi:MAG: UDP-3-O-acyl-N-acetylglucosamine deacetylase [Myxococcota bacterium]|nr:UDP-3-O-acyl-N-acetylglucosamine deacetylase [Myxococcota bacterium]